MRPSSNAPFLLAVALAAFLLFNLELLAGRLVLPAFGGVPAVWTTALCFFTAMLFLAYLYAHLVATRLSFRAGSLVHAALTIVVIVLTFSAPQSLASLRHSGWPVALDVLVALAVVAGPAAFLLASTTPLLSAWYAGGRTAPWWLYAASNAASLTGLLAYPFVVAPLVPLSVQRSLLVAALVGYGAVLIWIVRTGGRENPLPAQLPTESSGILTHKRQAFWLLAAFVPAGLLSATTNFIQTDLIAAPFIWIGPLGVYLASFIVVFSERGRRALPLAERLAPAAATLLWVPFLQTDWPVAALLLTELTAFFVLAVAIHGRLAIDRPAETYLTRFYLIIALGGLLATAFVALIAPVVFSQIYEYPLLIVSGLVVLGWMTGPSLTPGLRIISDPHGAAVQLAWRLIPFVMVAGALYILLLSGGDPNTPKLGKLLLLGAAVVSVSVTPRVSTLVTLVALASVIIASDKSPLHRERSFFGVVEVEDTGKAHFENSGSTLHGMQFTNERRVEPTSYYVKAGPLGQIFDDLRRRTQTASVGVVGLGVGTIAAYGQRDDQFAFFEIDPAIIRIAADPRYFTYLRDAAAPARLVTGDGRLLLAVEPPASFDLVILDAFTSDVVPAHLLTREAMTAYLAALRPGGIIAFHVTSRYYRLIETVGATARSLGLEAAGRAVIPDEATIDQTGARTALWAVVGAPSDVARFTALGWRPVKVGGLVLTDDYSDLTRMLTWTGLWGLPENIKDTAPPVPADSAISAPAQPVPPDPSTAAAALLDQSLQHAQAGRFTECFDLATQSANLVPSAPAFNNIGWCAGNLQLWDEAIRNAEEAIRISPNEELYRNNLEWIKQRKLEAEEPAKE